MRKALIAAAVATALFAVGAFAASFTLRSEDTASGSNPVQSCAESATVDFTEGFDNASNNWRIDSATVTLTDADSNCEGADVELVLQNSDNSVVGGTLKKTDIVDNNDDVNEAAGAWTLVFEPATPIPVGDVWNAAVLVDGLQLSTT